MSLSINNFYPFTIFDSLNNEQTTFADILMSKFNFGEVPALEELDAISQDQDFKDEMMGEEPAADNVLARRHGFSMPYTVSAKEAISSTSTINKGHPHCSIEYTTLPGEMIAPAKMSTGFSNYAASHHYSSSAEVKILTEVLPTMVATVQQAVAVVMYAAVAQTVVLQALQTATVVAKTAVIRHAQPAAHFVVDQDYHQEAVDHAHRFVDPDVANAGQNDNDADELLARLDPLREGVEERAEGLQPDRQIAENVGAEDQFVEVADQLVQAVGHFQHTLEAELQQAAARLAEEQEATRLAQEQEATRLAEEQAATRLAQEQEATRLAQEQEATRLAEEQAATRLAEEQAAARLAEEQAATRLAEEQEATRLAEEQAAARLAEEQAAARLAEEQAAARLAEEQAATRLAEELAATRLAEEQEATRLAEEQAAARLAEEQAATRLAEEQAATRLAEEQAATRLAEEQAAARLAEEQDAARLADEQDVETGIADLTEFNDMGIPLPPVDFVPVPLGSFPTAPFDVSKLPPPPVMTDPETAEGQSPVIDTPVIDLSGFEFAQSSSGTSVATLDAFDSVHNSSSSSIATLDAFDSIEAIAGQDATKEVVELGAFDGEDVKGKDQVSEKPLGLMDMIQRGVSLKKVEPKPIKAVDVIDEPSDGISGLLFGAFKHYFNQNPRAEVVDLQGFGEDDGKKSSDISSNSSDWDDEVVIIEQTANYPALAQQICGKNPIDYKTVASQIVEGLHGKMASVFQQLDVKFESAFIQKKAILGDSLRAETLAKDIANAEEGLHDVITQKLTKMLTIQLGDIVKTATVAKLEALADKGLDKGSIEKAAEDMEPALDTGAETAVKLMDCVLDGLNAFGKNSYSVSLLAKFEGASALFETARTEFNLAREGLSVKYQDVVETPVTNTEEPAAVPEESFADKMLKRRAHMGEGRPDDQDDGSDSDEDWPDSLDDAIGAGEDTVGFDGVATTPLTGFEDHADFAALDGF